MKIFVAIVVLSLGLNLFSQKEEHVSREITPFTKELKIIWKGASGNEIVDKPLIEKDAIYVVNAIEKNDTGNGQIFCYNKRTGELKWKSEKHYGEPLQNLVSDGDDIVYTTRRAIISVSKKDGKTNWSFSNPFSMMIGSTPAVFGDIVIAANSDNMVFAFSKSNQKLLWEKKLTEIATPELNKYKDDVIFPDSEDGLYSLDAKTGKKNWYYKIETGSSVTVEGDRVYLGTSDRGILCLDAKTGDKVWETSMEDGNPYVNGQKYFCASSFSAAPIILGDKVIGGDYTHTVLATNLSDGKKLWADYYPDLNRSELTKYGENIILVSEIAITVLDPKGKIIDKYKMPKNLTASDVANYISIEGNMVYMSNEKGQVVCVEL